jgi:hypothetical protein
MYTKEIVASLQDFEDYWTELANEPIIGVQSVVVGDLEDVMKFQKNAVNHIYPLLFVHIPPFDTSNVGGNLNGWEVDFVIMDRANDDNEKKTVYKRTHEIVMNIQLKLDQDTQNGMFDFNGKLHAEPKPNLTNDRCYGWMVSLQMASPGVGIDSDYRP